MEFDQEVPTYTPGLEDRKSPLAKKISFVTNIFHDRLNVHSQHVLAESLKTVQSEPEVQINTRDAKARRIKHGDVVKVYNDRGSCNFKGICY